MSKFGVNGTRCDWCGKISNRRDGEYARPSRFGYALAGYIRQPEWERNHTDANGKHDPIDSESDICEECAADRCPGCGSDQVVKVTPATPGPVGWGGRCKECGQAWEIVQPVSLEPLDTLTVSGSVSGVGETDEKPPSEIGVTGFEPATSWSRTKSGPLAQPPAVLSIAPLLHSIPPVLTSSTHGQTTAKPRTANPNGSAIGIPDTTSPSPAAPSAGTGGQSRG